MNLKKYLENRIRGWLPKESNLANDKLKMAEAKTKVSKPRWWKPLWITALFMVIIFVVVSYFLLHYPLSSVIGGMAISLLGVGIAYYIRVRPSMTVNRVVYILGGIGIGWVMWVLYAITGIGRWATDTLGVWPSLIIGFAVFYTIGALIGDWIGKRRNYQLPLSL
jgi:hypothetical protein